MGLRTGRRIKVWKIEDKGSYASCRCSTSSKPKDSDKYETDWSGFINFCGEAYKKVKAAGEEATLVIGEFEVRTRYDREKKKEYVNYSMFTVGSDDSEKKEAASKPKKDDPAPAAEPDPDDDPF